MPGLFGPDYHGDDDAALGPPSGIFQDLGVLLLYTARELCRSPVLAAAHAGPDEQAPVPVMAEGPSDGQPTPSESSCLVCVVTCPSGAHGCHCPLFAGHAAAPELAIAVAEPDAQPAGEA